MIPYFSFLNYKDSDYQLDNGFISNIQVLGDNLPLTVTVSGPNGYTAGPFVSPSVIPALTSLEPGLYILTVINITGETSNIEITIAELLETVLTATLDNPCNCTACNCTLSVINYTHNSECFTYNLYKDGSLVDTYSGCTDGEQHEFINLCSGQYTITAIPDDVSIYIYNDPDGIDPVITQNIENSPGGSTQVVFEGCPCYIATDCEDSSNQILIRVQDESLEPELVYQFEEYPGKCWTIEIGENCDQQTIILNTGLIDSEDGPIGAYNTEDFKWKVVGIAPLGAVVTPFPARIANQSWYSGYGIIPGAAWITKGGTPNGSGNLPHDTTTGLTIYSLDFNVPLGFIPLLNLQILTDNTAIIFLNGIQVFDNSSASTPWVTPSLLTLISGFNVGTNTLTVQVNNVGTGSNGFALSGSITTANPPSELVIVSEIFDNCELCVNPVIPNICYDLEVVCGGACPNLYGVNSFDFSPYIGQNISIQPPISTDPECWYTPYAIRQAVFANLGTQLLSWPFGSFQGGTNDITFGCTSLVLNTTEYITGTPPSVIMTPATYNPVECTGLTCTAVSPNTTENSFTNIPDFINAILATAGILTVQAFSNDPDNCPICEPPVVTDSGLNFAGSADKRCQETFRIQYRDGDTFQIVLTVTNNTGTRIITLTVANNNITTQTSSLVGTQMVTSYQPCNDNIYCALEDEKYDITGVTVEDPCPPPPLGEACEIHPRLGEPGFSVKNCDPKKVIDIKTKFADSVFAWFKRDRYGINTCCEFDLDKIDIKNQLIDLGAIYDPDMCVDGSPIPGGCCPQPCNAVAVLLVPQSITCPPPTNVDVLLEVDEIPTILCEPPTTKGPIGILTGIITIGIE